MKKGIFILFVFLVTVCFAEVDWVGLDQIGTSGEDGGYGVTVDNDGNVIVTGAISGELAIGDSVFTNEGDSDFIILKYDSEGNLLWSQSGGSAGEDICYKAATDSENNIYICGHFGGNIIVNGVTFETDATREIFVAKLSPEGQPVWIAITDGSAGQSNHAYGIYVDDYVYVTGGFEGTTSFGETSVTSDSEDIYVAKLTLDGAWTGDVFTSGGGDDTEAGEGLVKDSGGNLYVAGHIRGNSNVGGTAISCEGLTDVVLIKLNSDFEMEWFDTAGSSSIDMGLGITLDANENPVICGMFRYDISFGEHDLTSAGGYDAFVSKIDPEGNWLWAVNAGSSSHEIFYGISRFNDELFVVGRGRNTVSFGDQTYESYGSEDVIWAKLDSDGNCTYLDGGGSADNDNAIHVATNPDGNIYLTGFFNDGAIFNEVTYNSSGAEDMFVINLLEETVIPIDANFDADVTSGSYPLTVNFTDLSTGEPTTWQWDFDNDGTIDSEDQNPTYVFEEMGSYSVLLIASNETSSDSLLIENYITVTNVDLIVDFEADTTIVNAPGLITFTDLSTGNPTAWNWDFDNNGTVDSEEQNPSYIYTEEGSYSVKLILFRDEESLELVMDDYIQVNAPVMDEIISVSVDSLVFDTPQQGFEDGIDITIQNICPIGFGEFDVFGNWVYPDSEIPTELQPDESIVVNFKVAGLVRDYIEDEITITTEYGEVIIPVYVDESLDTANENDTNMPFTNLSIFPNPFNPVTNIAFDINQSQNMKVDIYNVKGQFVKNLSDNYFEQGHYNLVWNGVDADNNKVGSGVYFSIIKTDKNEYRRKMILLK